MIWDAQLGNIASRSAASTVKLPRRPILHQFLRLGADTGPGSRPVGRSSTGGQQWPRSRSQRYQQLAVTSPARIRSSSSSICAPERPPGQSSECCNGPASADRLTCWWTPRHGAATPSFATCSSLAQPSWARKRSSRSAWMPSPTCRFPMPLPCSRRSAPPPCSTPTSARRQQVFRPWSRSTPRSKARTNGSFASGSSMDSNHSASGASTQLDS